MKELDHQTITEWAFDLLNSYFARFQLYVAKSVVAKSNSGVDAVRDLEFIDIEAGIGGGHGRDNPHKNDGTWTVDDEAHYREGGKSLTGWNHYIDIRKGSGKFDDFDGYSYMYGSGRVGQYEDASEHLYGFEWLAAEITGYKVDEGLAWWFDDEYVHAPGHRWYRKGRCSPSIERYSYYQDKGRYSSMIEEAKARFPRGSAGARAGAGLVAGVPYSVFMPVDNMARYWFSNFTSTMNASSLGFVAHAIQDASIPHHAAGCHGNWHGTYELKLHKKLILDYITRGARFAEFGSEVKSLFEQWWNNDMSSPNRLTYSDRYKTPSRNWRIDMLVTWMALHAYHDYKTIYNNGKNGKSFNVQHAKELTTKATALTMLMLAKANDIAFPSGPSPFDRTRSPLKVEASYDIGSVPISVIKRDGQTQSFSRNKLTSSMIKAGASKTEAKLVSSRVFNRAAPLGTVSSKQLSSMTAQSLSRVNTTASRNYTTYRNQKYTG